MLRNDCNGFDCDFDDEAQRDMRFPVVTTNEQHSTETYVMVVESTRPLYAETNFGARQSSATARAMNWPTTWQHAGRGTSPHTAYTANVGQHTHVTHSKHREGRQSEYTCHTQRTTHREGGQSAYTVYTRHTQRTTHREGRQSDARLSVTISLIAENDVVSVGLGPWGSVGVRWRVGGGVLSDHSRVKRQLVSGRGRGRGRCRGRCRASGRPRAQRRRRSWGAGAGPGRWGVRSARALTVGASGVSSVRSSRCDSSRWKPSDVSSRVSTLPHRSLSSCDVSSRCGACRPSARLTAISRMWYRLSPRFNSCNSACNNDAMTTMTKPLY